MGLIYALVAAGLSLIFGLMDVVNFAHGELLMLAMYATFVIWLATGVDPLLLLIPVALLLFVIGVAIYRLLMARAPSECSRRRVPAPGQSDATTLNPAVRSQPPAASPACAGSRWRSRRLFRSRHR